MNGSIANPSTALDTTSSHDYWRIRDECVMVTASDRKHTPYLLNAITSIHRRFPDHPTIQVFDIGMSQSQRNELSGVPWIALQDVESFVPHWKQNWSWKPYILNRVTQRYVLYFDAANIVVYKSLAPWFGAIAAQGYFLLNNGQRMGEITPSEYWAFFNLPRDKLVAAPTFGAGLMGFDMHGFAANAIKDVLALTIDGWTLGRSATEFRKTYDSSVIRDCECFRADQTLFNLAFRRYCPDTLMLLEEFDYCGKGGAADHPDQFIWYSRRQRSSLIYFWQPIDKITLSFWINRLTSYATILTRYLGGRLLRAFARRQIW